MDIKLNTQEGKFKFRVAAIIENGEEILVLNDERSSYTYLPGGHVMLHESTDEAILREVREELKMDLNIIRPLWLNQGFFTEDVSQKRYHEVCMYYLFDGTDSELIKKGKEFILREGEHTFHFQWVKKSELKNMYFYPTFLKEKIMNLPETLQMHMEIED